MENSLLKMRRFVIYLLSVIKLVKDHVIIPPANNIKTAKERLAKAKTGEFECFDWWFCHKKLGK